MARPKTGKIVHCNNCGKGVYKNLAEINRSENHYCSRSCAAVKNNSKFKGENARNFVNGFSLYRKIVDINNCTRCGFSDHPEILEVHHRDRNTDNNSVENLEVLCPNCHQIEHLLTNSGRFHKRV